jgi:hypothetical protein
MNETSQGVKTPLEKNYCSLEKKRIGPGDTVYGYASGLNWLRAG